MSATTLPKRETEHHSGGGLRRYRPFGVFLFGSAVFITAWAVWTFWFSSAIPK